MQYVAQLTQNLCFAFQNWNICHTQSQSYENQGWDFISTVSLDSPKSSTDRGTSASEASGFCPDIINSQKSSNCLVRFYNLQIKSESEWEVGAGGEAWGGCPRGEKVKNFKFLSWEGFLILAVWIGGWRQRRAGEGWPKEGKNISSSGSPSLIRSMPSSSPPPHKNQLIMMGPGTPWTSCSMSSSYWKGRWRLEDNPWSQSSVNRWLMAFEGIWCFVWQFGNA